MSGDVYLTCFWSENGEIRVSRETRDATRETRGGGESEQEKRYFYLWKTGEMSAAYCTMESRKTALLYVDKERDKRRPPQNGDRKKRILNCGIGER